MRGGGGVYFFAVNGLAKGSYIQSCYTNRYLWNKFEPNDIGEQIGYEFVGNSRRHYARIVGSQSDRSFITDIGIDKNKRHNKHLVFTNKNMAEAYLKYMKNSASEQIERDHFLDMFNFGCLFGNDYDDDHYDYNDYDDHEG